MRVTYSKLKLIYDFFRILKYNFIPFFIILFIFIVSDSIWTTILFYVYVAILLNHSIKKIIEVFCTSFTFTESGITEKMGFYNKITRFIPFDKIQNIQTEEPFLMRLLRAQKVMLESGEITSDIHLMFIQKDQITNIMMYAPSDLKQQFMRSNEMNVLFRTSFIDLVKASVGTFLFILLFPAVYALFQADLTDFLVTPDLSIKFKLLIVFMFILALYIIAFAKVFFSYFHYEVTMDDQRVYISKGVLNRKYFSIHKEKIQAVVYKQAWYQKLLNVTTVKLNSTGEVNITDEKAINALFPYIGVKKAQLLVEKIAPEYQLKPFTNTVSPNAFYTIFYKIPYYSLFICIISYFFDLRYYYYILAAILAVFHYVYFYLEIKHQQFRFENEFYQIKTGGFTNEIVICKRSKVVDLQFKETILQRKYGIMTAIITARSIPITETIIKGISKQQQDQIYQWFAYRKEDMK